MGECRRLTVGLFSGVGFGDPALHFLLVQYLGVERKRRLGGRIHLETPAL